MDTPTSRQAKWLRRRAVLSVVLAWVFVWTLTVAIGWGHWWYLGAVCVLLCHVFLLMSVLAQQGWLYNWGRLQRWQLLITLPCLVLSLVLVDVVFPMPIRLASLEFIGALIFLVTAVLYAAFPASRVLESIPILVPARR